MASFSESGNHIRLVRPLELETVAHFGLYLLHSSVQAGELSYSWLPSPVRQLVGDRHRAYVLESGQSILGWIKVLPLNHQRSAWQVDSIALSPQDHQTTTYGTQLIRHCLEACYEARNWIVQVDVSQPSAIGLYRHNGFQPLAHLTNWQLDHELLQKLADHHPALPNLLPVSNSDATLLYQLDTAAMPPHLRQVYDLTIQDFRHNPIAKMMDFGQQILRHQQEITAYVYEPQRKAAIGYFRLLLERSGTLHNCQLTVHPAYTWLYPELIAQIARTIIAHNPSGSLGSLCLTSADYQPEREAYLEQIKAVRASHGLLMARSVWHKVREAKPILDALQLSQVLAGLQPPAQRPVPGRIDSYVWNMKKI